MSKGGVRLHLTGEPVSGDPARPFSAMAGLFLPLRDLLCGGGDPRLGIDPARGVNQYGCRPLPCPDTLSFASSTATSISERAYDRVSNAREQLARAAIALGIDEAFDARVEAMRGELKACLGLPETGVDVVFSPSGTDCQLQALALSRALLGPALTTVVVAADQTGSGTADTARGRHFGAATANGCRVRKGEPIAGLADSVASIALPLFDANGDFQPRADHDAAVLDAVERALASGTNVLLQIMDCSKLGWRAPGEACLEEIATRWPDRVKVVVDACQMRLGRPRLRGYLDRGYIVIVTGSKFFTGPAFSGALLVPACLAHSLDAASGIAEGLCDYSSRSDWPRTWSGLRACLPIRPNFGQWLRWEAALEEMRTYYNVPAEFRRLALTTFGGGVERIIAASPSLRPLPLPSAGEGGLDEELGQPTIFPVVIQRGRRALSMDDCRTIHRALSEDAASHGVTGLRGCDDEIAAKSCLVGQPVALGGDGHPAALRICAGARIVTETWSPNEDEARANVQRELGHVGEVVSKIEWLLTHTDGLDSSRTSRSA